MFSASATLWAQTQVLICGGAAVVEGEYQIVAAIIFSGFLPLFGCVWFCLARFSRDGTDGAHLGHTANWGGPSVLQGQNLFQRGSAEDDLILSRQPSIGSIIPVRSSHLSGCREDPSREESCSRLEGARGQSLPGVIPSPIPTRSPHTHANEMHIVHVACVPVVYHEHARRPSRLLYTSTLSECMLAPHSEKCRVCPHPLKKRPEPLKSQDCRAWHRVPARYPETRSTRP
jgi:hypothetical protein